MRNKLETVELPYWFSEHSSIQYSTLIDTTLQLPPSTLSLHPPSPPQGGNWKTLNYYTDFQHIQASNTPL